MATGTANREETYNQKATDFQTHAKKMAETASSLAKSGVVTDRQMVDALLNTSKKVGRVLKSVCMMVTFHSINW